MTALKVGDLAPDFTLPATFRDAISLSQYRGQVNVVLVFYPFDWSPVCSLQLSGIQANLPRFQELNAQVLGISVDRLGVIRYVHVNPVGEVPDNKPVLDVLRKLA